MKRAFHLLLPMAVLLAAVPEAQAQKVGSTSMQFLKVMPSARATALGDAYAVWANGADAVFWNPAGVALMTGQQATLNYIRWIFDTQQGAFSYAINVEGLGVLGAQLQYVDFGAIEEARWEPPFNLSTEYPGLTGTTFRPYAYLLGLTYAARITDRFSTGLTVKHAFESLYGSGSVTAVNRRGDNTDTVSVKTWANGFLFDFGLNYNTGFRSVRIAASMQNFGANVRYALESNPVPLSLRVGVAADLIGTDALLTNDDDLRLGVAFDLFQPNDYAQQAHAGVELEYRSVIALRVGNKIGYDADGLTMGLGIRQPVAGVGFSFDYSFASLRYQLGSVHRLSMGVDIQ
jgi:long-subunit fatty acid transport protein